MKVGEWTELRGLKNGRGLEVIAYTMRADERYCEISVTDGEHNFFLGSHLKNRLSNVVSVLHKYGFDIEHQCPFDLVEFLKTNFRPRDFIYNEYNYYFYSNVSGSVQVHIDINYNHLQGKYFEYIGKDRESVAPVFLHEAIKVPQLMEALKELGWL